MAEVHVELHVPLTPPPDLPDGAHSYPWIDAVEGHLAEAEVEDDGGEEVGDYYVFDVFGEDEGELLDVVSRASQIAGVPSGAFAVVRDEDSESVGEGRRVEVPLD